MFDTVKVSFSGDESVELVPSLDAMELINERFGNITNAINEVGTMNFNAIVDVIDAGIETKVKKSVTRKYSKQSLKEAIFKKGVLDVMADATEFVMICANGGKRPKDDETEENVLSKKKIV